MDIREEWCRGEPPETSYKQLLKKVFIRSQLEGLIAEENDNIPSKKTKT